MRKVIILITLVVIIINFSSIESLSRVVREGDMGRNFFFLGKKVNIMEGLSEQEVKNLDQNLTKYVLKNTNSEKILNISSPIPASGGTNIVSNYKFKVVTTTGEYVFNVKKVGKLEGKRYERASQLNIAPEGIYLSSGYIISKNFNGMDLAKILRNRTELLSENGNYRWIFKKLGQKIATMENNNIFFRDIIHFNTIVNLEEQEIAIIDYQTMGGMSPEKQVRYLVNGLQIGENFKKEILDIFNYHYKTQRKTD